MAKKMYQRPDGLYEKKITLDGRRVVFRAKTQREVMQKIAAYQARVESGPTFAEVAEEWWAYKEHRLSPNTVSGYRVACQRAVERFGNMRMSDITATQIRGWLDWLASRGYARKTVANHLIVAMGICSWACENYNTPANPATLVHVPDGLAKSRRTMPTQAEIDAIKALADTPDGRFFYFLMYTGLRRGEALALQWQDIDAAAGVIHVRRSLYWAGKNQGAFKEPKTEAGKRDVIYLDRLREVMEPHRGKPEEYIFGGGDLPLTHTRYRCMLDRFRRDTGSTCTPHQMRHAFATLCFEAGIPEKTAQGLLGHAQLSTTADIYTELRDKKRMEAAAALNAADFE